MNKRRLKNRGSRPKAFFGESIAAAVAGATIAGGFQMAATKMANDVAKENARNEAKTIIQNAKDQAQAIKDQTAKSREYQQEAQEFVKEQNTENRELQKDIQMQLQMLTGQQNVNDRLEASKIKVKAGGKTKKLGYPQSLLRGGNMPFTVTDGGGVVPVGLTPEGFELYEIVGNDHEHYHKTRGGKYKSGVGIKFADGNVVEGEGNQKKNGGELMLVTPDNAYFISKHFINGFNPAEGVKQGLHPLQAYAIQEQEKDMIGINDDGTKKAKFGKRRFLIGGTPNLYDYANMSYPQVGTDTIGDTVVGVAYGVQNPNKKRSLKCGGKARVKALTGGSYINNWWNQLPINQKLSVISGNTSASNNSTRQNLIPKIGNEMFMHDHVTPSTTQNRTTPINRGGFGSWVNRNADLVGSFLSGGFNILGAALSASNARDTANIVADAQRTGTGYMRDAYNSLKTIDMNSLRKEDYRASHMMPVLQAPVSFAAQQISGVDRKLQRRLRNAGRYSASSAAAQERMANADVEDQDEKNRIYSADQQQMQQIRQQNAERVSEASRVNAMLDTQANQQYGQDYLKLLQYNNDIENTKILGAAGANTEGLINSANTIAQGRNAASQSWVNAFSNIGLTTSNTLSSMAKRRADFENTMLGATTDAQINQIARSGSRNEKIARLNAVRAAINSGKLSSEDEAKYRYYEELLSKSI